MADFEKLIAAVQSLSPRDRARLREVLAADANGGATAPCESHNLSDLDYQKRLQHAGLLKSVMPRARDQKAFERFRPVKVSGKPVSETIIEERG